MKRLLIIVFVLSALTLHGQTLPPNQVALGEARKFLEAGRNADALTALERITPPAPQVLNALRTSKDFDAIRNDARFIAVVQKLTPCSAPEHRQFDFWLGSWEVKSAAGQVLGRNRISRKHGGCVLFEEWESAGGGTGSSFSFYDENTKQWHQFWVDATGRNWLSSDKDGNPTTLRGGIRDGAMLMLSHPDSLPSIGAIRVTWKPLPDGRVRQTFDSSSDGGKTWSTSFDGFYNKLAESR